MSDYPEECPHCHTSLIGEPIPLSQRKHYGRTHFMRVIAIIDQSKDRAVSWKCPDCGHEWPKK